MVGVPGGPEAAGEVVVADPAGSAQDLAGEPLVQLVRPVVVTKTWMEKVDFTVSCKTDADVFPQQQQRRGCTRVHLLA